VIRALIAGALAATGLIQAPPPVTGWLTFGNDPGRSSATARSVAGPPGVRWAIKLPGRITSQPLVVRGAPGTGRATVYAATSAGAVYAVSDTGRVLWHVQLGKLAHDCQQLDGYGVTGTPVVDRSTRSLYAADAFGALHALALDTGKERPGWPVRLYSDFHDELVWGALADVRGSIYAGTGSYCDEPMVGKTIRVDLSTRAVSRWISVPAERGGGGGIWGWGGLAYSASRGSLLAVTGNAFHGGSNDGDKFREWVAYGEHLIELAPNLRLRGSSHPKDVHGTNDFDFVGSPVLATRPGCSELAVALNKNGRLYAWRTAHVAGGPAWSLRLSPADPRRPLISQPAYSPSLRALFVVTGRGLVKIELTPKCKGKIAWTRRLGAINSTPTVAGDAVWVVAWHTNAVLLGIDARTGAVRSRRELGRDRYLVGPTIVDGRIYLGSFAGLLRALG